MAITVNSNLASLNAQRNLTVNSAKMSKTLARLSSGKRINTASDDAAGLAISVGFESQIRGMNQAVRNANDGLSLLGVADAALGEQAGVLQRVRELAVQSANDTNSKANRTALNNEVAQLKQEFDRIAKTTSFNGMNLLDGSFAAKDLQVGAYAGSDEKFSISLGSSRASDLGNMHTVTTEGYLTDNTPMAAESDVKIAIGSETYNLGIPAADGVSTAGATTSALAFKNAVESLDLGITVEAKTVSDYNFGQWHGTLDDSNYVTVNGVVIKGFEVTSGTDTSVADYINSHVDGVTATLPPDGHLVLTAEDGRNITVTSVGQGMTITGLYAGTAHGEMTMTGARSFTITQNGNDFFSLGGTTVNSFADSSFNVSRLDVSTKTNAGRAMAIIDSALDALNAQRGTIGAQTSRLNSAVSALNSAAENATSAQSRIVDADFAGETAEMSRSQILQQAAVSVLSQANQAPQLALKLLGS